MLSGLGATIAQGFAFGTGSAIAHRAVGAVADSFSGGSSNQQQIEVVNEPPLSLEVKQKLNDLAQKGIDINQIILDGVGRKM